MKGNVGSRDRDDAGAIGIGTMIVFIAMVIVAAVAAAVLINTSGNLQRKSQETGSETQEEVSGNLFVRDIVGNVTDARGRIEQVDYYVSLAPGAEPIDLQQTILRWDHAQNFTDLQYDQDTTHPNFHQLDDGFDVVDVYDAGDGDKLVLDEGDKVKIRVTLSGNGTIAEAVETRNQTSTLIMPPKGTPVNADWTAPDSFSNEGNVDLG